MKKAIIIGATSGLGFEVAKLLVEQGWQIGIAGRRESNLAELKSLMPDKITTLVMDVTCDDASDKLEKLIEKNGGMDLFLLSSGVGYQNMNLDIETELKTVRTNADGFVRMPTSAYKYFKNKGNGHIAVISSIAGTKGMGIAPAYSATKRFQSTYIDALEQLAHMSKINIHFTDIRPGFVKTAILDDNKHYPLLMQPQKVAKNIIKAIQKKKRVAIIDWKYRFIAAGWQLIPRSIWKRLPVKNN